MYDSYTHKKTQLLDKNIEDLNKLREQLIYIKKTTKEDKIKILQAKEVKIEKTQRIAIIKRKKQDTKRTILDIIKKQDVIIKRGNKIRLKRILADRLRNSMINKNDNQMNNGLAR